MTRERDSSGTEWEPRVGYSRAVRVGDEIHVSGPTATDDAGAVVGLVVAVGPLVALTPTAHAEVGSVLSSLGFGLVAALATVGYQRTRSVWVPALLFAIHGIVLSRELAPVLAGLFG